MASLNTDESGSSLWPASTCSEIRVCDTGFRAICWTENIVMHTVSDKYSFYVSNSNYFMIISVAAQI